MCSAIARWSATTVVSGGSASSGGGDVVDADDGEVVGAEEAEPPETGEDGECRLVVVCTDSGHGWCHGPPAGTKAPTRMPPQEYGSSRWLSDNEPVATRALGL